jgi:NAD(P)-dependent dehydrogenase (short-subunit alcohol dehydrogenase family)
MELSLAGKVAFITGGVRGQGRAHAVTCARAGVDVVLFDGPEGLDTVRTHSGPETRSMRRPPWSVISAGALVHGGDVRSQAALDHAVDSALTELGAIES